ncbi:MAG: hypothetical protein DRN53_04690 [Thermoprotei archaeon]|nr:MAG: hypothetical protein DRN53_04690 [Thermoprotei archaeon]
MSLIRLKPALKQLALELLAISVFEKAQDRARDACILIARESLVRISHIICILSGYITIDEHIEKAISELRRAYKLLDYIAFGEFRVELTRSIMRSEENLPLLLDEAHAKIHLALRGLIKSKICADLRDIIEMLDKARRDTSPTRLYKKVLELLREDKTFTKNGSQY